MKILINTPSIKNPRGGVANHFAGLKPYWNENVYYNFIGDRNNIPGIVILPFDLLKFTLKCIFLKPNLIVLNPSLASNALKRDAIFLKIAKTVGIKTVVFFHGWNKDEEHLITENPKKFLNKYNKADSFLVLASDFEQILKRWGVTKPIFLTTTKVDDRLLKDFDLKDKEYSKEVLFLARVEAEKGIFIALEAFEQVQKKIPDAKLIIAGNGNALDEAKTFVAKSNIQNVIFKGKISGEDLRNTFRNASIYILPTSHGEGMPTSILEAMAFGLPIISRPIGGMTDFFQEKKMGFLLPSLAVEEFAAIILQLLENPAQIREIGELNNKYARKHFLASKVSNQLEEIFHKIN